MSKKMLTKVGTSTLATLLAVGAPVSVMATPKTEGSEGAVDEIVLNEASTEDAEAVASLLKLEADGDLKHDQLIAVHFVTGYDNDAKRGGLFTATKPSEFGAPESVAEAVYQRQSQEVDGKVQQAHVWTVYYRADSVKLEKLPDLEVMEGETFNGWLNSNGEAVTADTLPKNGDVYFANYTSNVTYEYNALIQEMIQREQSTSSVIYELDTEMGAFGVAEMDGAVDFDMSYGKDRLFVAYDNTAAFFGAPEVMAKEGHEFLGWFKEGTDTKFDSSKVEDGDVYVAKLQVKAAKKDALRKALDEASTLKYAEYTEESWGPFGQAIADGEAIYLNEAATQEMVDNAVNALADAKAGLVKKQANKEALRAALDEAKKLKYDEYTEESWKPFGQAMADGEAVYLDENATQEAVDKAIVALQNATEGLKKKEDKPAPTAIYTFKVTKPDMTRFTMQMKETTTVQKMFDKLTSIGTDVSSKNVTVQVGQQEAVALDTSMTVKDWMAMMGKDTMKVVWKDEANKTMLTCEMSVREGDHTFGMVFSKVNPEAPKVDKTKLEEALTAAKALKEADYTADTWAPFAEVLARAESVFADVDATQKSVDEVTKALTDAQGQLQKIVIKDALKKAIDDAKVLVKDDYTEESWTAFAEVLDKVEDVYLDNGATQEAVDKAVSDLQAAIEALVKKEESVNVDKSQLEKAIADVKALKEDEYTADSWKVLQDVLTKAERVQADEKATQETVDAVVKELTDAKAALVKKEEEVKVDKTKLEKAIADAGAYKAEDYTKDSWMKFEVALKNAQTVQADDKASQEMVDKAVKDLSTAVEGLVKVDDEKPEESVKFALNITYPGKNIGSKEFDSKTTVSEMKEALTGLGIDCSKVKAQQIGLKTPNSVLKDENTLNAIANLVKDNGEIVIQGYADADCKEKVGHLIRVTSSGENKFNVIFEEAANGDGTQDGEGQKPNDGQKPEDGNKDPNAEENQNAKKYTLKVSTVDGKTFDATVNDTSTIKDLMDKFAEQGVNCKNLAKVTMKQAKTDEVAFDVNKTVKDVVALLTKGDVQLIGYGEDGKAVGCAVISLTEKDGVIKVVFSKDTNVTLRTAEDIKNDGKGKGEGVSQEGKGDGVAPSVQTADSNAIIVYSVAAGLLVLSVGGYVVYTKKLRK